MWAKIRTFQLQYHNVLTSWANYKSMGLFSKYIKHPSCDICGKSNGSAQPLPGLITITTTTSAHHCHHCQLCTTATPGDAAIMAILSTTMTDEWDDYEEGEVGQHWMDGGSWTQTATWSGCFHDLVGKERSVLAQRQGQLSAPSSWNLPSHAELTHKF